MKTETWIDKSDWIKGPWMKEPDRVEWEVNGIQCLALRNPNLGIWCGYVGLEPGHPWYGKGYNDIHLNVHGGLTYAGACMQDERPMRERVCHRSDNDELWWIGFDCGHGFDFAPGMESILRARGEQSLGEYQDYRTLEYVQEEIRTLVSEVEHNES